MRVQVLPVKIEATELQTERAGWNEHIAIWRASTEHLSASAWPRNVCRVQKGTKPEDYPSRSNALDRPERNAS